jgi:two-component sensor histidine kinase/CHASE1-domain containing sensor protein
MRNYVMSRRAAPAWLVLAGSLLCVWLGWHLADRNAETAQRQRFDAEAKAIAAAVETRIEIYQQSLRAAAAFLGATGGATREAWRAYVNRLEIDRHYPGIQGFGYTTRIRADEVGRHEEAIRAEGFPEYRVWPNGDREPLSSIVLLEPFDWRNQRAFGFDMMSEPIRRAAMEMARDTGEPATTAKVVLVQETETDRQAGFLVYVPVYGGDRMPEGMTARRDALEGWVYAPFRAGDLMAGIREAPARGIKVDAHDGRTATDESLLHEGEPRGGSALPARFETEIGIDVGSRRWTLAFRSLPAFEAGIDRQKQTLVLFGGLGISILLFATAAALGARRATLETAHRATQRSLREKEVLLREVHHRVKNSLQIVIGMLAMQGRKSPEPTVRQAMDEAAVRVRAIAQIHERLYVGDDVTSVDFSAYLRALCDDLAASAPDYALRIQAEPIDLPTDKAIPLGLILVELVTNAIKHAAAPDHRKAIDVRFRRVEGGAIELQVRDHGIGLPAGFSLERAGPSLGTRVIQAFALQLDAEALAEDAEPGARWRIRLPA